MCGSVRTRRHPRVHRAQRVDECAACPSILEGQENGGSPVAVVPAASPRLRWISRVAVDRLRV